MRIEYSRHFVKMYASAPKTAQSAFDKRLAFFLTDSRNPILNNHQLRGEYREFRSINITGDWRAIFQESLDNEVVTFLLFGTHSKLYG